MHHLNIVLLRFLDFKRLKWICVKYLFKLLINSIAKPSSSNIKISQILKTKYAIESKTKTIIIF